MPLICLMGEIHQFTESDEYSGKMDNNSARRVGKMDRLNAKVVGATKQHWRQFIKKLTTTIFGARIYHTWKARNWKQFKEVNVKTEVAIAQIQK
uniref:Uncharacterized protein n=1 Tax=Solanum demissum TaxID=50514 RepID=Q0KIK4_SOLDE|nr:hypothetical protein SDM1_55t00010 [Solanum demissum]